MLEGAARNAPAFPPPERERNWCPARTLTVARATRLLHITPTGTPVGRSVLCVLAKRDDIGRTHGLAVEAGKVASSPRPHKRLKHGASKYASLRMCDDCQRRVAYVDMRTSGATQERNLVGISGKWEPAERVQCSEELVGFAETGGKVIADSRCKRNCAGEE